jgi:hypothetical protein
MKSDSQPAPIALGRIVKNNEFWPVVSHRTAISPASPTSVATPMLFPSGPGRILKSHDAHAGAAVITIATAANIAVRTSLSKSACPASLIKRSVMPTVSDVDGQAPAVPFDATRRTIRVAAS